MKHFEKPARAPLGWRREIKKLGQYSEQRSPGLLSGPAVAAGWAGRPPEF
jgi:hypothetical protein